MTVINKSPKTLRDEFAMAALSGIIATPNLQTTDVKILAGAAYGLADAMMEARKK